MICGREFNMSELSDTARQCGDKLADAASRASDYVSDKVSAVGCATEYKLGKAGGVRPAPRCRNRGKDLLETPIE